MSKIKLTKLNKSIFIFRRDFALEDNIAFIECYKKSDKVLPIFIFTPEQATSKNKFFSSNCYQFMIESLESLDKILKEEYNSQLHYYYGDNVEVLTKLLKEYKYDSIYFNIDYTNYAKKRDKEIIDFSNKNNINCITKETYLLNNIGTYLKIDGTEYLKFTPFKINALKTNVPKPIYTNIKDLIIIKNNKGNTNKFDNINFSFKLSKLFKLNKSYTINQSLETHGGRDKALNILKNIKEFKDYDEIRNDLADSTTHLSAYIKFGCVSIREVYHTILTKLGVGNGLITQLYWREFYYYLTYYNPRILEGFSLKPQYNKIKWNNDKEIFKHWCNGSTGFPVVDAGMREMNETGYMHNRARLITSNILIKILNIDWRFGEKYFSNKLIDYDPSVNNGNWQWSSGSGSNSQVYFRVFSIELQTKRFDPECLYIKKFIPELKNVPIKDIFNWIENYKKYPNINYPKPIVDYKYMRKHILNTYKKGLYS
jgi:deoxyribodipyrimidine photo-lyase